MKKRNLIMIALMLVASVSVTSVLMLLTAKTNIARNTVMMSNGIAGKLVETDKDNNTGWKDAKDDEITLQYPNRMPGDVITKKPRVERTDVQSNSAADAYVAVKVQLMALKRNISTKTSLKEADHALLSFTDTKNIAELDKILQDAQDSKLTPYRFYPNDVISLYEKILSGTYYQNQGTTPSISPEWKFFRESKQDQYSDTGWFFYVNAEDNAQKGTLKVLPPLNKDGNPAVTDVIFTNIAIPSDLTPLQLELYSVLAHNNIELYLKFTAYLTQSDNSPYLSGTTLNDFSGYMKAFPQIAS